MGMTLLFNTMHRQHAGVLRYSGRSHQQSLSSSLLFCQPLSLWSSYYHTTSITAHSAGKSNRQDLQKLWRMGESDSLLTTNSHQFYSNSMNISRTVDRLLSKEHVLVHEAIQQDLQREMPTIIGDSGITTPTTSTTLTVDQYLGRIQRQMQRNTQWSVLTGSAASSYARTSDTADRATGEVDATTMGKDVLSMSNNASVYLPYLKHALTTTNQMVFITGGDNVGRSALLQQLQVLCPRDSLILLDGRIQRPPVQQSILDAVTDLLKRLTAGEAGEDVTSGSSDGSTGEPSTSSTTGSSGGKMGALSTITSAATAVVAPASAAAAATRGSTAQQLYSALLSVGAKVLDRAVSNTVATEVTLFSQLQSMICNTIESEPHGQGLEKVLMALQDTSLNNQRHRLVSSSGPQTGSESPSTPNLTGNISESLEESISESVNIATTDTTDGPLLRAMVFDHAQEYFLPSQFRYSTAPVTAVPTWMTVTPSYYQVPLNFVGGEAVANPSIPQPSSNPVPTAQDMSSCGNPGTNKPPSQSPAAPNNVDVTTSDVLQVLLGVCKQKSRLSVIFSSSNSLFPYDLQSTSGYNLLPYLNTILVVTEMSPFDAMRFLQQEWSVGPNLARLLVEYFGGSLTQIENTLQTLFVMKEDFHLLYGFNAAYEDALYTIAHELTQVDNFQAKTSRSIVNNQENNDESTGKIASLLHDFRLILSDLAMTGFVAISRHNEIIRALLKTGLVLYVPSSALAPLIPSNIRKGQNGIIPVNQSVRIVIAKVLQQM